jgi:predicted DNA-binding transcriptional regulator YafY
LLRKLSDGHRLTTAEAADHLDVSARTIRNLRAELEDAGIPVQRARDGHATQLYLRPEDQGHYVEPLHLTEQQMQALTVAINAAAHVLAPTPYHAPLQAAFRAVRREWLARAFTFEPETEAAHWHFGGLPQQDIPEETFAVLAKAIRNRQTLVLDYYTASRDAWTRDRRLDPYVIARRQGSWMLAAYCHEKQAVRDFSLAGMQHLRPYEPNGTPVYFGATPDFDPHEHFRGRGGALAGDAWVDVRLLVEPNAAPYFKRKRYHASQRIEEEQADGRLVVHYRVRGLRGFVSGIRSWGRLVTVLEPQSLREELTAEFYELAGRYVNGEDLS